MTFFSFQGFANPYPNQYGSCEFTDNSGDSKVILYSFEYGGKHVSIFEGEEYRVFSGLLSTGNIKASIKASTGNCRKGFEIKKRKYINDESFQASIEFVDRCGRFVFITDSYSNVICEVKNELITLFILKHAKLCLWAICGSNSNLINNTLLLLIYFIERFKMNKLNGLKLSIFIGLLSMGSSAFAANSFLSKHEKLFSSLDVRVISYRYGPIYSFSKEIGGLRCSGETFNGVPDRPIYCDLSNDHNAELIYHSLDVPPVQIGDAEYKVAGLLTCTRLYSEHIINYSCEMDTEE